MDILFFLWIYFIGKVREYKGINKWDRRNKVHYLQMMFLYIENLNT